MTRRVLRPRAHFQSFSNAQARAGTVIAMTSWWLAALLLLATPLFAGVVRADVALRVEAIPIADPIQGFVTVTDANGDPVGGLDVNDFTVTLDGTPITIPPGDFTLPPADPNSNQQVSVVFALDYSGSVQDAALAAMQQAVTTFINTMNNGDFAAIVKFSANNGASVATVVQPFTQIDGAAGAGNSALISAVMAPFTRGRTNLTDGITVAVEQFAPPTALPAGPRAVIVISDGDENASEMSSEFTVIADATENSIPIFLIGVGTRAGEDLMTRLSSETGGQYFPAPTDPEIAAAYVTISDMLSNEYLLSIRPQPNITDCNDHTLQVSVMGETASATFARCAPTPPPPPPPPGGGNGGGGGGGAVGAVVLLAGLVVLASRRRRTAMNR
jgi:Ca-activated chloride channel family protein